MGECTEVVPDQNKVILSTGELTYDYLIFATGTEANYFGMENIRKNAMPMKTIEDALAMRTGVLQNVEKASRINDESESRKLLSVVIAGGGPTGVEIAGMLAEMKNGIFLKEYPEMGWFRNVETIYLVDGGDTVLAPMSKKSQKYTYNSLKNLGVVIKLNAQVADYDGERVLFKDNSEIKTKNLIWAAGVTGTVWKGIPETSYGRGKRLLVNEYHQVKDFDNIFAVGDISLMLRNPDYPNGHPQMAQPAI